jgi:hypothetical protein
MNYFKTDNGEYEHDCENAYDAVLVLGDAMTHAAIHAGLYYDDDWDWKDKHVIAHDTPVCFLNLALKAVIREAARAHERMTNDLAELEAQDSRAYPTRIVRSESGVSVDGQA